LAFDELLERALDAFVREAKAGGNWSRSLAQCSAFGLLFAVRDHALVKIGILLSV
jgi:hypothetical protein